VSQFTSQVHVGQPTAAENRRVQKSSRPVAPRVNADGIPAELKARRQWVGWRYAWVIDAQGLGRWTKVPYRGRNPKVKASTTDPKTWGSFKEAFAAYLDPENQLDGIGFVFSADDDFVGIDLDNCIGPDGEILPWAQPYIEQLTTYGDLSPSGRGIKFIGIGSLPGKGTRRAGIHGCETAVEAYDCARFFTVTGNAFEDIHTIEDIDEPVKAIYVEIRRLAKALQDENRRAKAAQAENKREGGKRAYGTPSNADIRHDDEALLDRARKATNGPKFIALYDRGDITGYRSPSEADYALVNLVAYWTGPDAGRIERIVSRSALGLRGKWAERDDYRKTTITNALAERTEYYNPSRNFYTGNGKLPTGPHGEPGHGGQFKRFNLTDTGNGERMVRLFGDRIRYVHDWHKWLVWDGKRWKIDNTAAIYRFGKATSRSIYGEAQEPGLDENTVKQIARWAIETESKGGIDRMVAQASREEGIPALHEDLDQDPWLLNCRNCTVDLRTGKGRPHDRGDMLTKMAPVDFDPDATCPLWMETLRTFLVTDALIDYLQRLFGMAITGVIEEHILAIPYGTGSNGKSTILGALLDAIGTDYGMKAPPDLLLAKQTESHPTDRADLFGKRVVVAIETEDGRRLNESLVKEMTGGDKIRARRMREDFWEFAPTHTIFLATNHKPQVRGTDHGIWRRIKLVPFSVQMTDGQAKKDMPRLLRKELPGILAWLVRGCLAWQAEGLKAPKTVTDATTQYREDEDVLGVFIAEHCIIHNSVKVKAGDIYTRYKGWSEASGLGTLSMVKFGKAIEERGYRKERSGGIWYHGIGLLQNDPRQPGSSRDDPLEHLEQLEPISRFNKPLAGNGNGTGNSVPTVPSVPKPVREVVL